MLNRSELAVQSRGASRQAQARAIPRPSRLGSPRTLPGRAAPLKLPGAADLRTVEAVLVRLLHRIGEYSCATEVLPVKGGPSSD